MMTWQGSLLALHVICITLGYGGIIIALSGLISTDAARRIQRVFGPLLGIGLLLGFAVVGAMGLPFTAKWLIASYAIVILALAWAALSQRMKMQPPIGAIGMLVFFVLLVFVMTLRPY